MRKIVVAEFVSLDGVMQAPGGADEDTEGGFAHGGWTAPYWHDDIGAHFFEAMSQSDALLLGRKTWQIHGGAFEPMAAGDPFGDVMNTMPKYVVSSTLTDPEWTNTTVLSGEVPQEVAKLKEQHDGDVVVHGSRQLAQTLLENDLVDELRLMVFPVVLGKGKRLFGETSDKKRLQLVDSKTVGDGVVILTYRRSAG